MNRPASFSSTAIAMGAVTPSHIVSENHIAQYQPDSIHPVSADTAGDIDPVLHECLAECRDSGTKVPTLAEVQQELDDVIADLADAAVRANANGDPQGARIYVSRMYTAIRSRTAEHQARLNSESLARIDADPCYFSAMAELARQRIEQERAE